MRLTEEAEKGIPESKYDMEKEHKVYHEFRNSSYMVDGILCNMEGLLTAHS